MRVLFITGFVFLTDQITKLFVKGFKIPFLDIDVKGMYYGESINVIGSFFKLTFVENPGMAFGIDVGNGSKLLLSLFSLIASIGILYYLYKVRNDKFILRISLALILAGALGNLVDRTFYGLFYGYAPIFYGKVVDFLNLEFWDFTIFGHTYERWPIFNIADASVTIGVLLLIFFHREEKKESEKESAELKIDIDDFEPSENSIPAMVENTENDTDEKLVSQKEKEDGEDNNKKEVQI